MCIAVSFAWQVDFPTAEPWRINEDTQANVPVLLSGFESSAIISVSLMVEYGTLLAPGPSSTETLEPVAEAGENYTLSATQDDANAALEALWYVAPSDWNSAGQGTFEKLSVVIDDQNSAQGGDPYPGVPRSLVILVLPVNDPPSLRGPAEVIALESYPVSIFGIEAADPDVHESSGVVEVTVSVAEEGSILELGTELGLYVSESSNESKTFQGSLKSTNNALAGLSYLGPVEFSGRTELSVTIQDGGNTGEGGSLSASLDIPIYVSSVNDPPRVTREGGLLLDGIEDEAIKLSGIVVEDTDAGAGQVRLTLDSLHGAISLPYEQLELEFDEGDGLEDATIVVIGSVEVRLCADCEVVHCACALLATLSMMNGLGHAN